MFKLFLLFTIVPFVELYLLLAIGQHIGVGATIALVILTGIVGSYLARREGTRVIDQWRATLAQGQMPTEPVFHGVFIFAGGLMLITPGVLTDLLGFAMVVPVTRSVFVAILKRWLAARIAQGQVQVMQWHTQSQRPPPPYKDVIDVEGEEV